MQAGGTLCCVGVRVVMRRTSFFGPLVGTVFRKESQNPNHSCRLPYCAERRAGGQAGIAWRQHRAATGSHRFVATFKVSTASQNQVGNCTPRGGIISGITYAAL